MRRRERVCIYIPWPKKSGFSWLSQDLPKINGILLESAEYPGSIPEYSLREELGHVLFVHMHGIYGGIKLWKTQRDNGVLFSFLRLWAAEWRWLSSSIAPVAHVPLELVLGSRLCLEMTNDLRWNINTSAPARGRPSSPRQMIHSAEVGRPQGGPVTLWSAASPLLACSTSLLFLGEKWESRDWFA